MNSVIVGRRPPPSYERFSDPPRQLRRVRDEHFRRTDAYVQQEARPPRRDQVRHERLLAEDLTSILAQAAGSDLGSEQPDNNTAINTTSYVSLDGLAFNLVTPVRSRGLIVAELDFTTTTIGTLWAQVWVGGKAVRTRKVTSDLGLTFGTSASAGGLTITAPIQTFGGASSRVVDVKCKAEDGGDFSVLSTSLVFYTLLAVDEE